MRRRRGPRIEAAVVLGLLALVLGCSSGRSPNAAAPVTGVAFGASVQSAPGESPAVAEAGLEGVLGRTLRYDRDYLDWDDPIPNALMIADRATGRTTVLSIRPTLRSGPRIGWAQIASGADDAQIRRQARQLRAFGTTVLVAFHHEADIASGFGTPAQFVAAYRHVVSVFRASGATNVRFVLILTPSGYRDIQRWYPGGAYVDWLATDAYNFGSCAPGQSGWRTLATAAGPFYAWASRQHKPLMLAEFGSAADPSDPGRQAQWYAAAATTMAGWSALHAVIFFDHVGTCDWRPTAPATLAALRQFARSAQANPTPTARLVISSATQARVSFSGSGSTGGGAPTGTGVTRWIFDPGDGGAASSGAGEPAGIVHGYRRSGHWTARLTITDRFGHTATTSVEVST